MQVIDYLITSKSAQRDSSILMSLVKSYFTVTEAQSCYSIKVQLRKICLCQAVSIHLTQIDADVKFKNSHRYFCCVHPFFYSHPFTCFALVPSVLCILCPLAMKVEKWDYLNQIHPWGPLLSKLLKSDCCNTGEERLRKSEL